MLIMTILYGCSKDNKAPTFAKFSGLMEKPDSLIASYLKSKTNALIYLRWEYPDTNSATNSVKMYNIAWSDSNVFDLGNKADIFTNSVINADTLNALEVVQALGYTADFIKTHPDSFIIYFTVSAVYNNAQFNEFIGPRSDVDSTLVKGVFSNK
jgi:hypothetical protein